MLLPGASAPWPAVTLSDTEGHGERARSRRSAQPRKLWRSTCKARRLGRSGATGRALVQMGGLPSSHVAIIY
jgi:hypothetical protein